jgi:hypothetical protein
MTFTIPRLKHKYELSARAGGIAGGEITPKGFAEGHAQPSWILLSDFDYVVHPFFTLGAFAHVSNMSFEQYSGGKKTADGNLLLASVGASFKGRIPLNREWTAMAGMYAGRNFISASTTSSDSAAKTSSASGGGWDLAFAVELSYLVGPQIALVGHAGFVSQVAGSVSADGKDHDLAFTPLLFATVGPEVRF